jgi:hypothetical protein
MPLIGFFAKFGLATWEELLDYSYATGFGAQVIYLLHCKAPLGRGSSKGSTGEHSNIEYRDERHGFNDCGEFSQLEVDLFNNIKLRYEGF